MTEAEWLTSIDIPYLIIKAGRGCRNVRKSRLLACAYLARFRDYFPVEGRELLDLAEEFADGKATKQELEAACRSSLKFWLQVVGQLELHLMARGLSAFCSETYVVTAVRYAARYPKHYCLADGTPGCKTALAAERSRQLGLLRCVFGNPFRTLSIDPIWQTATVVALAQAAYDNRIWPAKTLDPGRLAILADAVEEAGCTSTDILKHLRQPMEHVRGCHVVDLCLGLI